jgi:hypothetical protein
MLCRKCNTQSAIEYTVSQDLDVAGTSFMASLHAVRCVQCGHVEPDQQSHRELKVQLATRLACAGVHNRQAFGYIVRVIDLDLSQLARAIGVPATSVQRWMDSTEDVPPEVMAVLARLLGSQRDGGPALEEPEAVQVPN